LSDLPMHVETAPTPRLEAICQGDAYAMGLAQGEALRGRIHAARRTLTQLEAFRLRQPWWCPYTVYRWGVERRARRHVWAWTAAAPALLDRLRGIAAGARLSEASLALFNVLESVLGNVTRSTACPRACSAVAVRGRRSAIGTPLIAHNFDYLPVVQPYYTLRDSRPNGKLRSLDFTIAPFAGAVDGVNEHGLAIAYDYAFTTDAPAKPAAPISATISDAREHCRTVEEAAARIMADHGPTGIPDDFTPCVHGSYWQTTACLQLLPASRTLRVAYANACQAEYQTLQL
jgi:predicted choloylglycine hydrolase